MKINTKNKFVLLIVDALIILICITGIYSLRLKAFLPFKFNRENSFLIIKKVNDSEKNISIGDTLISVDNFVFKTWEECELYTDTKNIGEIVSVKILNKAKPVLHKTKLVNYYSAAAIAVISFVGLLFVFLAVLVELKSEEKSARLFHFASIGLVAIITLTKGNFFALPPFLSFLNHFIYLFAFTVTPVIFLHFTVVFTKSESEFLIKLVRIFYSTAMFLTLWLFFLYYRAMESLALSAISNYVTTYSFVFRPFLLVTVLITMGLFFRAYKQTRDLIQRRKLNWLLLGFLIGPAVFVLFWVLPMIISGNSLLGEAPMHILLTAVPITFSIAIVKYRLLDINLLLERSVVYTIVFIGIIASYILIFTALTFLVKGVENIVPAVAAAIIISLFLNPIKNKAQQFVDRKFFRIEYDFREEQKKYLNDIKNSDDVQTIVQKVIEHTDKLIPLENLGFFLARGKNKIQLVAQKYSGKFKVKAIELERDLFRKLPPVFSLAGGKTEPGLEITELKIPAFESIGAALVFPLKLSDQKLLGVFVLGRKKSGLPFNKEDVDLLNSVVTAVSITIERIQLQRKLIREKMEAEKLEELNRVRSFFVSTVSHELKTPLTSIQMFTEMILNNPNLKREKIYDYLKIVKGETERLKKLINNILNFTQIEKGIKTYEKQKLEFNSAIEKIVERMRYQFVMSDIKLSVKQNRKPLYVFADPDALEEALTNLLSNAIKYSPKGSSVEVSVFNDKGFACVSVKDRGKGVPENELEKIFRPFYRIRKSSDKSEGTGLGLAIVKHIVKAHNGRIKAESKPGSGCTFTIYFPLEEQ